MSNQKKGDYKDDNVPPTVTPTTREVIDFVKTQVILILAKYMDGKNLESIREDFGKRLVRVLFIHFKKWSVSQSGALRLLADLSAYHQECGKLFTSEQTQQEFHMLKDLANLFMLSPDNLGAVLEESSLSRMEKQDLVSYIKLRADFKSIWLKQYGLEK